MLVPGNGCIGFYETEGGHCRECRNDLQRYSYFHRVFFSVRDEAHQKRKNR